MLFDDWEREVNNCESLENAFGSIRSNREFIPHDQREREAIIHITKIRILEKVRQHILQFIMGK